VAGKRESQEMKKDGTLYLVYCKWPSQEHWQILKWGVPAAFSDKWLKPGWINPTGLKIKTDNCVFVEFYELDNVLASVRKNTGENNVNAK
jgi:hypothetical protein